MNDDKHTCEIYHFDLYGTREEKYNYLQTHNLNDVEWQQLTPQAPSFFFVPKDFGVQEEYEKGFGVAELMKINSTGIETRRDSITIQLTKEAISKVYDEFCNNDSNAIKEKYKDAKDSRDWKLDSAQIDIKTNHPLPSDILYRPFDNRYTLYTGQTRGFMGYPFYKVMRHLKNCDNLGLITTKSNRQLSLGYFFLTEKLVDRHILDSAADATSVFPLYLYPEEGSIDTSRRPNLDEKIWAQINTAIGKEATPEDIFDYIYGILHSPSYRAKYKEFLKVDFPRIPYPKDQAEFEHFRSFGNRLRELHLMHNLPESPVTFPKAGSMAVEQVSYDEGRVRINATQYFANVPADAWNFYIGGYQPAQKWLKDRKGRTLSFDDIKHYCKIIAVLMETKAIMDKIG